MKKRLSAVVDIETPTGDRKKYIGCEYVLRLKTALSQGCSANKKGVGTHAKIAILKQLQTHFKAKCEKVWERRPHAFPPHYTPVLSIKNKLRQGCPGA